MMVIAFMADSSQRPWCWRRSFSLTAVRCNRMRVSWGLVEGVRDAGGRWPTHHQVSQRESRLPTGFSETKKRAAKLRVERGAPVQP